MPRDKAAQRRLALRGRYPHARGLTEARDAYNRIRSAVALPSNLVHPPPAWNQRLAEWLTARRMNVIRSMG